MGSTDDYDDAHRRHWCDAEILFGKGRYANADHLYGISAECGMKAVMRMLNRSTSQKHVNDLWREFVDCVNKQPGELLSTAFRDREPFSDWHIAGRYENAKRFQIQRVAPHRDAVQHIRTLYDKVRGED